VKRRSKTSRTEYYAATTTIKISRILKKFIIKLGLPDESVDKTLRRLLHFSEAEREAS